MAIKFKDAEGVEHELPTSQEITDMITGAVKAHTKKLSDDLTKKIGEGITGSLADTLTAFESKIDEKVKGAAPAPKQGEGGQTDIEQDPKFKGLQKQLAELAKKAELAEKAAAESAAKQRDAALRTTLQERLIKAGIDPKRAHLALGVLVDAQKRVRLGDDDSLVFRGDDNEEVDLETGLKAWTQTDDAKTFMPPRGASGSGDRQGGKAPAAGGAGLTTADLGRSVLAQIGFGPQQG